MKNLLKSYVGWIREGNGFNSDNPLLVFGRVILSIWILILAFTALMLAILFLRDPNSFMPQDKSRECVTVETNGGDAVNSCDYLTP